MELNFFTLSVQFAIYLFIIFILKVLYFDPVMALLRRRDALTVGRNKESEDLAAQIEELQFAYEERIESLRKELDVQRVGAIQKSRDLAEKKIQTAKSSVEQKLNRAMQELNLEVGSVHARLPQASADVAQEIVSAVMGARVVRL